MWAFYSPASRFVLADQNASFTFVFSPLTARTAPPPSLLLYTQQVSCFSEENKRNGGKKGARTPGVGREPSVLLDWTPIFRPVGKYEIQSVHYLHILCKIESILQRVLKALRFLC